MKKSILSVSLAIASLFSTHVSAQSVCLTPTTAVRSYSYRSMSSSCTNVSNYIPQTGATNMHYNVNIHYFSPSTGAGPLDTITLAKWQDFISNEVTFWDYYDLQTPTLPVTGVAFNPTHTYVDFTLKNLFHHVNDSAFNAGIFWNDAFYTHYNRTTAGANPENIINMYYIADPDDLGSGRSSTIPINIDGTGFIVMSNNNTWSPTNFPYALQGHELGHAVGGLIHTNISPTQFSDYALDTGPWGWNPCTPGVISNNIMGYNQCQSYLSPMQIGNYNMLANTGVTTPFTTLCTYDTNQTVRVSSNQTWTTSHAIGGDLIVKAGNLLTINCDVSLPPGGSVIIEPTAKLVLDGGRLTTFCDYMWNGVKVWGSSSADQSINATTHMPNHQGMLSVINGGTIQNAEYGISLVKADTNGSPIDWTTTGGIVQAIGGNFINNSKDVAFWPYTPASVSYFKGCTFSLGTTPWIGWSDARVSLFGVHGVNLLGNTFSNTSTYLGYGVQSTDAGYSLDSYTSGGTTTPTTFNGFNYGIYAQNVTNVIAINVFNCQFSNLQLGGLYLGAANSCGITGNSFTLNGTTSTTSSPDYGMYLDHCTGYTLKSNTFSASSIDATHYHYGLYINASGTDANSAYNNTFTNLNYGLWAGEQNQGGTSGATGLAINCNDFTNCTFNVGTMGTSSSAGVMKVQGTTSGGLATTLVRNTYSTPSCGSSSGSQNKWYIDSHANSYGLAHASFTGATYEPTPQPYCGSSLITVTSSGLTYNKSTDCPYSPPCGPSCRMAAVTTSLKGHKLKLQNMPASVDGTDNERQNLQDNIDYENNQLGLLANEKIYAFINDTTLANPMDSVIAVLKQGQLPSWKKRLLAVYIHKGDYTTAQTALTALRNESADNANFCDFHQLLISMKKDPAYLYSIKNDGATKTKLIAIATDNANECQVQARAVLKQVFNITYKEALLQPIDMDIAARTAATSNTVQLTPDIKMYPNPAANFITIEYQINEGENAVISFTDLNGRMVKQVTLNQQSTTNTVNVADVPNGVYMVNLTKNGAVVANKKIVLMK